MAVPSIFSDVTAPQELYFISSMTNAPSILEQGILSHKRAQDFHPIDISNGEVQERRSIKIPENPKRQAAHKQALAIHQYANVYIRAHNAMLFVRADKREELCVFRVDPQILLRDEVIIANQNASKDAARFYPSSDFRFSPESSSMLKEPLSYVWSDRDTGKVEKRKAVRQAEVLVPYEIHPSFIRGIFVASEIAKTHLLKTLSEKGWAEKIPVDIHPSLFFTEKKQMYRGLNPLEPIKATPLRNDHHPDLDFTRPESSDEEEDSGVFTMDP